MKPIHKALKALLSAGCNPYDSYYPSFVPDKKLFCSLLKNMDVDENDAIIMSRMEGSTLLPAKKVHILSGEH